jgi:chemotaxis protein CheY-P-specific phosphatase CheC
MQTAELNDDLRDGFQEIANIAVGQTADKLARSFSAFVKMPIPKVHLLESADVSMALTALDGDSVVTAVTQAFFGDGISGEALLLFIDAGAGDLSALMGYPPARTDEEQCERVLEMASLLAASCIHSVLAQLNVDVLIAHPVLLGRHRSLREMFGEQQFPWDRTLALELNCGFEGYAVNCELVLLFHQHSLPVLFGKLELLI